MRGNLLFVLGQPEECQRAHETALALAREAGSPEAECAALGGLGDARYAQARIVTGARLIEDCVAMAREQGFLKVEMAYLPMLAWAGLYMMQLPRAIEIGKQALAMATRLRNPRAELMALSQMVMLDGCVRGNHREALPWIERALEGARMLGSRRMEAVGWFYRALLLMRAGDLDAARSELAHAFELFGSDSGTLTFVGPQLYGVQALLSTDAPSRRKALASGEALLKTNALSHNHFALLDFAIQSSVDGADWDEASRYCDALEAYCAAEPLPWSDFIVARGRALVRHGRGEGDAELLQQLQSLRQQIVDSEMNFYLTSIDAALTRLGQTSA